MMPAPHRAGAIALRAVGVLTLAVTAHLVPVAPPPPAGARESELQLAVGLSVWTTPHQAYQERALEAVAACGIRWVRVDFSWGMIEPAPGQRRWDYYDMLVESTARKGIRVLGILAYSAPWTTSDPKRASDKFPPSDMEAFARFAGAAAERYRGRVSAWEIWNEPDHPGFWQGTAAQYAGLLAHAHSAIKRADAAAVVVLGGLAQGGGADPRFLERLLSDAAHPAGRHFDVMAFHTNFKSIRALETALAENRALLRRFGASSTVWVTESAYTSSRRHQRLFAYVDGAAAQERYVQQLVAWARREGVPFLSWAGIRDEPDAAPGDPYGEAGLIAADWTPKPAFRALCAAAAR
jgi:hypothetical protein